MTRWIIPLLILAGGCVTTASYRPGEHATARSPQGYVAADYDMIADGERLGEAIVWSDGTERIVLDGRKTTAVHVGFRIENATVDPLVLDPERVTLHFEHDGRVIHLSQPDRIDGTRTIPPDEEGELSLYFALPPGVSPRDVDAFRVEWRATAGALTYAQRTPFLEYDPDPAYRTYVTVGYYYSPFFDPFLYDPFFYRHQLIVHMTPFVHGRYLYVRRIRPPPPRRHR
jgi:hypothetical protein